MVWSFLYDYFCIFSQTTYTFDNKIYYVSFICWYNGKQRQLNIMLTLEVELTSQTLNGHAALSITCPP